VDPGLLLYLLRTSGTTAVDLEDLLEHKSGLLGVSGISGDLRDLEPAAAAGDARAALAMELFAYRAAKTIGGYVAALEGLDALAFSGGIGEHSAPMRERICGRLGWMGIRLDRKLNVNIEAGKSSRISAAGSPAQA
jgi:acetate kinase